MMVGSQLQQNRLVGSRSSAFDLIGDIHGHADELVELLELLGYRERSGTYRHESRSALFCGDFIDRGPRIRDVLEITRNMVTNDAAAAVMGNHEYNAIAFHTERPDAPGQFFRRHHERNIHQHQATLSQLSDSEMQSALDWFRTLPIAIDFGNLRVVHACWDPECLRLSEQSLLEYGRFTAEFLRQSTDPETPLFTAVERVLKGPEFQLPAGFAVQDKEGCQRKQIRIRWFEEPANHSIASYALPTAQHPELSRRPVEGPVRPVPYAPEEPPLFIGHYWMPEEIPHPLTHNVACLDYSVAKEGQLCAYRFDGEERISPDRFFTVSSHCRR